MKLASTAAALALALAAPAFAAKPFDPQAYQGRHIGAPTEVLVLGTPHLSGTPEGFDPAVLEPLLARLAAFRPDVIAIEALPGRSVAQLWEYREVYPGMATGYGGRIMALSALARPGVGLDMAGAEAEATRTLKAWPDAPTPAQRRRLAALFAAAGDPVSAVVQWRRLDPAERKADESVPQLLAEQLDTYSKPERRNENELIAANLAVRLGLERVHPMDDQSDAIGPEYSGDLEADFNAFAQSGWLDTLMQDPKFAPLRDADKRLTSPEAALATYRYMNSAEAGRIDADGQWLSMLDRESPNGVGRVRVALWEVRNLRMAANIREAAALVPGGRVLVVVGAAHKPWLDAYLGEMSDVRVVDAAGVLR